MENARQVYLGRADELQLSKQVEGCKADIKRLQAELAESVGMAAQVEVKSIYTHYLQEFVKQKKVSKPLLADIKDVQQQFESLLDAWCKFPATRVANILDKMFKGEAGVFVVCVNKTIQLETRDRRLVGASNLVNVRGSIV